ncbi:hypothetical protein, putative [Babesia caballi]|uniref:Hypothetcial protein, putative n=1 Tax=Babesia caballi TaxID=5871 RepID=A0AAV4LZ26_BABCB|nr:hypothetcial protein, putative [Babesia caballi]
MEVPGRGRGSEESQRILLPTIQTGSYDTRTDSNEDLTELALYYGVRNESGIVHTDPQRLGSVTARDARSVPQGLLDLYPSQLHGLGRHTKISMGKIAARTTMLEQALQYTELNGYRQLGSLKGATVAPIDRNIERVLIQSDANLALQHEDCREANFSDYLPYDLAEFNIETLPPSFDASRSGESRLEISPSTQRSRSITKDQRGVVEELVSRGWSPAEERGHVADTVAQRGVEEGVLAKRSGAVRAVRDNGHQRGERRDALQAQHHLEGDGVPGALLLRVPAGGAADDQPGADARAALPRRAERHIRQDVPRRQRPGDDHRDRVPELGVLRVRAVLGRVHFVHRGPGDAKEPVEAGARGPGDVPGAADGRHVRHDGAALPVRGGPLHSERHRQGLHGVPEQVLPAAGSRGCRAGALAGVGRDGDVRNRRTLPHGGNGKLHAGRDGGHHRHLFGDAPAGLRDADVGWRAGLSVDQHVHLEPGEPVQKQPHLVALDPRVRVRVHRGQRHLRDARRQVARGLRRLEGDAAGRAGHQDGLRLQHDLLALQRGRDPLRGLRRVAAGGDLVADAHAGHRRGHGAGALRQQPERKLLQAAARVPVVALFRQRGAAAPGNVPHQPHQHGGQPADAHLLVHLHQVVHPLHAEQHHRGHRGGDRGARPAGRAHQQRPAGVAVADHVALGGHGGAHAHPALFGAAATALAASLLVRQPRRPAVGAEEVRLLGEPRAVQHVPRVLPHAQAEGTVMFYVINCTNVWLLHGFVHFDNKLARGGEFLDVVLRCDGVVQAALAGQRERLRVERADKVAVDLEATQGAEVARGLGSGALDADGDVRGLGWRRRAARLPRPLGGHAREGVDGGADGVGRGPDKPERVLGELLGGAEGAADAAESGEGGVPVGEDAGAHERGGVDAGVALNEALAQAAEDRAEAAAMGFTTAGDLGRLGGGDAKVAHGAGARRVGGGVVVEVDEPVEVVVDGGLVRAGEQALHRVLEVSVLDDLAGLATLDGAAGGLAHDDANEGLDAVDGVAAEVQRDLQAIEGDSLVVEAVADEHGGEHAHVGDGKQRLELREGLGVLRKVLAVSLGAAEESGGLDQLDSLLEHGLQRVSGVDALEGAHEVQRQLSNLPAGDQDGGEGGSLAGRGLRAVAVGGRGGRAGVLGTAAPGAAVRALVVGGRAGVAGGVYQDLEQRGEQRELLGQLPVGLDAEAVHDGLELGRPQQLGGGGLGLLHQVDGAGAAELAQLQRVGKALVELRADLDGEVVEGGHELAKQLLQVGNGSGGGVVSRGARVGRSEVELLNAPLDVGAAAPEQLGNVRGGVLEEVELVVVLDQVPVLLRLPPVAAADAAQLLGELVNVGVGAPQELREELAVLVAAEEGRDVFAGEGAEGALGRAGALVEEELGGEHAVAQAEPRVEEGLEHARAKAPDPAPPRVVPHAPVADDVAEDVKVLDVVQHGRRHRLEVGHEDVVEVRRVGAEVGEHGDAVVDDAAVVQDVVGVGAAVERAEDRVGRDLDGLGGGAAVVADVRVGGVAQGLGARAVHGEGHGADGPEDLPQHVQAGESEAEEVGRVRQVLEVAEDPEDHGPHVALEVRGQGLVVDAHSVHVLADVAHHVEEAEVGQEGAESAGGAEVGRLGERVGADQLPEVRAGDLGAERLAAEVPPEAERDEGLARRAPALQAELLADVDVEAAVVGDDPAVEVEDDPVVAGPEVAVLGAPLEVAEAEGEQEPELVVDAAVADDGVGVVVGPVAVLEVAVDADEVVQLQLEGLGEGGADGGDGVHAGGAVRGEAGDDLEGGLEVSEVGEAEPVLVVVLGPGPAEALVNDEPADVGGAAQHHAGHLGVQTNQVQQGLVVGGAPAGLLAGVDEHVVQLHLGRADAVVDRAQEAPNVDADDEGVHEPDGVPEELALRLVEVGGVGVDDVHVRDREGALADAEAGEDVVAQEGNEAAFLEQPQKEQPISWHRQEVGNKQADSLAVEASLLLGVHVRFALAGQLLVDVVQLAAELLDALLALVEQPLVLAQPDERRAGVGVHLVVAAGDVGQDGVALLGDGLLALFEVFHALALLGGAVAGLLELLQAHAELADEGPDVARHERGAVVDHAVEVVPDEPGAALDLGGELRDLLALAGGRELAVVRLGLQPVLVPRLGGGLSQLVEEVDHLLDELVEVLGPLGCGLQDLLAEREDVRDDEVALEDVHGGVAGVLVERHAVQLDEVALALAAEEGVQVLHVGERLLADGEDRLGVARGLGLLVFVSGLDQVAEAPFWSAAAEGGTNELLHHFFHCFFGVRIVGRRFVGKGEAGRRLREV